MGIYGHRFSNAGALWLTHHSSGTGEMSPVLRFLIISGSRLVCRQPLNSNVSHMPYTPTIITFILLTLGCTQTSASFVQWGNQPLREVNSLEYLPVKIKTMLGAGRAGLDGLANRGEAFNSSDAVDLSLPFRRFIAAGVGKDVVLVALKHGGIAYYVEILLFSDLDGTPVLKQKWILRKPPPSIL